MADADTSTVSSDPNLNLAPIEVTDASTNEAELNAKISEELGIPPVKTEEPTEPETPEEPTEPEEPETPEDIELPTTEPSQEEEAIEPEVPAKPTEVATPSDEDLFIEVVDAEGVTHKISNIDDLPEDFTPKNNRQILEIIRATDRLDIQREQRAEDAAKAEEAALVESTKQEQFKSWDAEITELTKTNKDLSNSDYINDVFGYMNELNAARQKAGNPNLISSFEDALFRYQAKQTADKAEADKKNGNATAKAKTALIGRSSASAGGDTYVYRAGSARSIDDIPIN